MKDLPIVFKGIINVLLFIIYTVLAAFILGIVHGGVLSVLGKSFPQANDPIYTKMFIFTVLLVLIVSVVLRRYFYLPLVEKKANVVIKTKKENKKDTLDIKIEKEIK